MRVCTYTYLDGHVVLLTRTREVEIQVYLPLVDDHDHHVVARLDVILVQLVLCPEQQPPQQQQQQQQ